MSATDPDSGSGGMVSYEIYSGNTLDSFEINNLTGLVMTKRTLDREHISEYVLTLAMRDFGQPSLLGYGNITIMIGDANDNGPYFVANFSGEITEGTAPGAQVAVQVQALDLDVGSNAQPTYTIISGNEMSRFRIDNFTGEVTATVMLDKEENSFYVLAVQATEGVPYYRSATTHVFVTVGDANDNPPVFTELVYEGMVSEGSDNGTEILLVTATDVDTGTNAVITYSLEDRDMFGIDPVTGSMFVAGTLDRERAAFYVVSVTATDHGRQPAFSMALINITILDVNDVVPSFVESNYSAAFSEDVQLGFSIATVSAYDLDVDFINKDFEYAILSGDPYRWFSVHPTTGVITVVKSPDREAIPFPMVTVGAVNTATPSLTGTTLLLIELFDVNDSPPQFAEKHFNISVPENSLSSSSVGYIVATDPDLGENASLSFRITRDSSRPWSRFRINQTSGLITTRLTIDRERVSFYTLEVEAIDMGQPQQTSRVGVTVQVLDENDSPPVFTKQIFEISIPEDIEIGSIVGSVDAIDKDIGGNSEKNYTFIGGRDFTANNFLLNLSTGVVATASSFDREVQSDYQLEVMVTDRNDAEYRDYANITIIITDVNDNIPTFMSTSYNVSVRENMGVGTHLLTIVATDRDIAVDGAIEYLILPSNDLVFFSLHNETGVLKTARYLDRDSQEDYLLTVMANNSLSSRFLASYVNVTIHLEDLNDNRAMYDNLIVEYSISEDTAVGTVVFVVPAIDQDEGKNGTLSFELVFENHQGAFTLDSHSGIVTLNSSLDREILDSYVIGVQASDSGDAPRDASTLIYIYITDVNDEPVLFPSQCYFISIPFTATIQSSVLELAALDGDLSSTSSLTYSLLSGNDFQLFTLVQVSGSRVAEIRVAKSLLKYSDTEYNVTVEVTDGIHSNQASVFIDIFDTAASKPEFLMSPYSSLIDENSGLASSVLTVVTTPIGSTFSIISGNDLGHFNITSTGIIQTVCTLDYESISVYHLGVSANNSHGIAYTLVRITVRDNNDNPPVFVSKLYELDVAEATAKTDVVLRVRAQDMDTSQDSSSILYTLISSENSNHFRVDATSGDVYPNRVLDFENGPLSYAYTVTATNHLSSNALSDSAEIRISVIESNDNKPRFTVTGLDLTITEDTPANTPLINVTATDSDLGLNGLITYTLSGDFDDITFVVDSWSGEIMSGTPLDREKKAVYVLTVTATDSGSPPQSSSIPLTINIIDLNDNSPVWAVYFYEAEVYENVPTGSSIISVRATDPDLVDSVVDSLTGTVRYVVTNGLVRYSIASGDPLSQFAVNPETGDVSTMGILDREKQDLYRIVLNASDGGGRFALAQLVVTVVDTNDNNPVFSQSFYAATVPEDAPEGTTITKVAATDDDLDVSSEVSFSILHNPEYNSTTLFKVNDTTGVVTTAGRLDRETVHLHSIIIVATDGGNTSLSTEVGLNISVLDLNDNTPTFIRSQFEGTVYENALVNTTVATVEAVDPDYKENGTVLYEILSGNSERRFSIRPTTGEILVADDIDYETTQKYDLVVQATDSANETLRRSSSTKVVIYVNDTNDNTPFFDSLIYKTSASEATDIGSNLTFPVAHDRDSGPNADIEFYLDYHGDQLAVRTFMVDPLTGIVQTKRQLDREVQDRFVLTLLARDHGSPMLVGTASVVVTVTDVNDNTPVFSSPVYSAAIAEHSTIGAFVLQVSASDRDVGSNRLLRFSLLQPNRSRTDCSFNISDVHQPSPVFSIDAVTGNISVAGRLDREAEDNFVVIATVTDQPIEREASRTSRACVRITVTDINDQPPLFVRQSYSGFIQENVDPGTAILQVSAIDDDDVGANSEIEYSIAISTTSFVINSTSGVIYSNDRFNREVTDMYRLTVVATDLGMPRLQSPIPVTITVTDVNEFSPTFVDISGVEVTHYEGVVFENMPSGTTVLQVFTTDQDVGRNADISYAFVSSPYADHFVINSSSGLVTTSRPLDRETISLYELTVIAVDNGLPHPLSLTVSINVTVLDRNDEAPAFTTSNYSVFISEGAPLNQPVLTVLASDLDDGTHGMILYSIRSQTPSWNHFSIDSVSGHITVAATLDRESTPSYQLIVYATDRGDAPLSSSTLVTVSLYDENDNRPTFSPSSYVGAVDEGSENGTVVVRVSATDRDVDTHNRAIEYRIVSGNNASRFQIDPQTGDVIVSGKLDAESIDQFTLWVAASDGTLNSTAAVVVYVLNANDNRPIFGQRAYTFAINENSSPGDYIGTVAALDRDNQTVAYSIVDNDTHTDFYIDSTSGMLYGTTYFDYENVSSYDFTVRATDQGFVELQTTDVNVTVTIIDLNDNAPVFDRLMYNVSVFEDIPIGAVVLQLRASDADSTSNGRLTYILNRTEIGADHFAVDSTNGTVFSMSYLDRETISFYRLEIVVEDNGFLRKIDGSHIEINILDINDNFPIISAPAYESSLYENGPSLLPLLQLSVDDIDANENSRVLLNITAGNQDGQFAVNATTGLVYTLAPLDREFRVTYKLNVTAFDHGRPPLSSTVGLLITVLDLNDNDPAFSHQSYAVAVSESAILDTTLFTSVATDPDDGTNSRLSYRIRDGNANLNFGIDRRSGSITTKKYLDREATERYELIIEATDGGAPARRSSTRLNVTVSDVNDHAPKFLFAFYTISVAEDAKVGTFITRLVATDADEGINARLRYRIMIGNENGLFAVDGPTGTVTLNGSLDYETKTAHVITVEVRDGGSQLDGEFDASTALTVKVLDRNDHKPRFDSDTFRTSLSSRTVIGSLVAMTTAHDVDFATNFLTGIRYSIVGGNELGLFGIEEYTAAVTTNKQLSSYGNTTFYLNISVTDGDFFTYCTLIADIVDEATLLPLFPKSSFRASVPEDTAPGSEVVHLNASTASNYTIVTSDLRDFFTIDRFGIIRTRKSLDYEQSRTYGLSVAAVNVAGLTAYTFVCITVVDVNDNAPAFETTLYTASLNETSALRSFVILVKATDADSASNAEIEYDIVSGNDHGWFVVGRSSGLINTAMSIDRETTPIVTLNVTASNFAANPRLVGYASVRVEIQDFNDNNPSFALDEYRVSTPEDTRPGTTIIRTTADDLDDGLNGRVTYSLTSDIFAVNDSTGDIYTLASLNREAQSSYTLVVTATDSGSPVRKDDSTTVNVEITEVNEMAPVFDTTVYHFSIPEASQVGAVVAVVRAVDPDTNSSDVIRYSITSGNEAGRFRIDSVSGDVIINGILDFEKTSVYNLQVYAQDSGFPPLSSSVLVQIVVTNQNEHEPIFTRAEYKINIPENIPIGTSVIIVTAVDADRNQTITYHVTTNSYGSKGQELFRIDESTGEITVAALVDREFKKTHVLFVTAIDTGFSTRLSTTVRVTFIVLDLNDNFPVFAANVVHATVPRLPPSPISVTRFHATDLDEFHGNIKYSFTSGNEGQFFQIDNVTGHVTTTKILGDNAVSVYNITVEASDGFLTALVYLIISTTYSSDFCLPRVCYRTEPSVIDGGDQQCPNGWIASESGHHCTFSYCNISSMVVCPTNQTCIPEGRSCNGTCLEEGHARCPVTDYCEKTGNVTSFCDQTSATCYDGYVRVRTSDGSEWCQKGGTHVDVTARYCVGRHLTYCVEKDVCVHVGLVDENSIHPCQLCPDGTLPCSDTFTCVSNLSHCCPLGQFYCNLTAVCLNESQTCVLPNTPPTLLSPLLFLGSLDEVAHEKGVSVEFLMLTSGYLETQHPSGYDEDGDLLSLVITEIDTKGGVWEYTHCTKLLHNVTKLCGELDVSPNISGSGYGSGIEVMINDSCCLLYDEVWRPIEYVNETASLALPLLSRIRLRKAHLFQGAAWFKFRVWDGSERGELSKTRHEVFYVPSERISTAYYDGTSSFSMDSGLATYLVHPVVYVPDMLAPISFLPSLAEDTIPIDNTGTSIRDVFGGGVYLPNPVVYDEENIANLPTSDTFNVTYYDLLPQAFVEEYFVNVNDSNEVAIYRMNAYSTGTSAGACIALDPDGTSQGRWQVSTSGLTTTWTYLDALLKDDDECLLVSAQARLRFLPDRDFSGNATIRIRAWDGAYHTDPDDYVDVRRFLTAIISANSSGSVIGSSSPWRTTVERASYGNEILFVLTVISVPDEPVLVKKVTVLDAIPHRILYQYDHLFTSTVQLTASEFRLREENFRNFLVLILENDVTLKRIQKNDDTSVDVSFEIANDALKFNDVNRLITEKVKTLSSNLRFNITVIKREMASGTGAGCSGPAIIEPAPLRGTIVNEMVSTAFADSDNDFLGAAIVSLSRHKEGIWMFHLAEHPGSSLHSSWSPDSARWFTFPPVVSSTRAVLLSGHDRIRFVPHPDYHWSPDRIPEMSFKAWDESNGGRPGDINVNTDPYAIVTNSTVVSRGIFSFDAARAQAVRVGCDGTLNSGMQFDACCVCGGNGSSCAGCNNVVGSNVQRDPCDGCEASTSECLGCDFVPFSRNKEDNCSACDGRNAAPVDCFGECYGTAVMDHCSVCSEGSTGKAYNADVDCNGVCNGLAVIDECGDCVNGTTGRVFNQRMDCRGSCDGRYTKDPYCGLCQESSVAPLDYRDCAGNCFGNAFIDECGECSAAYSGSGTSITDVCGICGGNGTTCAGCDGVQGSQKILDNCGVCGGNDCSCFKITSIEPNRGPSKGGTKITVKGAGFTFMSNMPSKFTDACGGALRDSRGDTIHAQCKLESPKQQWQGIAQLIDHRTIVCTTPDSTVFAQRVFQFCLKVAVGTGKFTKECIHTTFTYDDTANTRIDDITPTAGIIGHTTAVRLLGDNLFDSEPAQCLLSDFGDCNVPAEFIRADGFISVDATFVNVSEYHCFLPAFKSSCRVTIALSLDGQQSGVLDSSFRHFTYFASAPEIVNVTFSDDVTTLVVVWDRAIETANRSDFTCRDIWDDASYYLLGGSTSTCSFQTYERKAVVVLLGSTATVSPGSVVTVKDDVIWTLGETFSYNATNASAMVSSLAQKLIPVSVIQASNVVPACGHYTADGLLSYNSGYRDLEYIWGLATEDSSTPHFLQLQRHLASFGRFSATIALNSKLFVVGVQYYLELQVSNVVGETSNLTRVPLTKAEADAPVVSIMGLSEQMLEVSKMAVFKGNVRLSECSNASTLSFLWRILIPSTQRGVDDQVIDLEESERATFVIPPHTLQPGIRYDLLLTVSSENASSTASTAVRTVVAPIRAVILGGNRTVSRNSTFTLDASHSIDFAESRVNAEFEWICLRRHTVCYDDHDPHRRPINIPREESVDIDASRFAAGKTYVFTVVVRKDGRSDSTAVEITISNFTVPVVTIWPVHRFISPHEKLSIRATVLSYLPVVITNWDLERMAGYGYVDLSAASEVKSTMSDFSPYEVNRTDIAQDVVVFTNAISQVNLVIKPGSLTFGLTYRFRLTAENADGFGRAAIDVAVEKPPSSGRLVARPERGYALDTIFSIKAEGWADVATDLPLSYQFGVAFVDEQVYWLSGKESGSILKTALPQGASTNSELTVVVQVFDQSGARAESRTTVVVYPGRLSSSEATASILNNADALIRLGEWSEGLAHLASSLSQTLVNASFATTELRPKAAEIILNVYREEMPPVDSQMLRTARLLEVATRVTVTKVDGSGDLQVELAFISDADFLGYDSVLREILSVTRGVVDHFVAEPVQSTVSKRATTESKLIFPTEIFTTRLSTTDVATLARLSTNVFKLQAQPVGTAAMVYETLERLGLHLCRTVLYGEERTVVPLDDGAMMSAVYAVPGTHVTSFAHIDFGRQLRDEYVRWPCSAGECQGVCILIGSQSVDWHGLETTTKVDPSKAISIRKETAEAILIKFHNANISLIRLATPIVSVSLVDSDSGEIKKASNLSYPITLDFNVTVDDVTEEDAMVCVYRPMGGYHGFNNTDWISDDGLIPVSITKCDVITVRCLYRQLFEFTVIHIPLIPPEITTLPPTPSPDVTTVLPTTTQSRPRSTQSKTTQQASTPSSQHVEPTAKGHDGSGGTPGWIAAVAVVIVAFVLTVVVLWYFCYYRKRRIAKMTVVPEQFELVAGGDREEYGVNELDGKEPMQVVNVDRTGDRRQLCVVRVLKTIRLRELRNVLIDEFVDDFKDQPFYFLTRHLKEVEPEDETMQFVRVVYEGDEVFVRKVDLNENDSTRLHFCVCGGIAHFECAECQSRGYCSPDCQRRDWVDVHIKECRTLGEKKRRASLLIRSRQTSVNQMPGSESDQVDGAGKPLLRNDIRTWRGYLTRTTSVPIRQTAAAGPGASGSVRTPARFTSVSNIPPSYAAALGIGSSRPSNTSYQPLKRSATQTTTRGSVASDGSFQAPVANFPKPSFDQEVPEGTPVFTMTGSSTRTSSGRQSVSRDLRSRPGTTTGALLEDVKEEEASRDDERTVDQVHEVAEKEKGND